MDGGLCPAFKRMIANEHRRMLRRDANLLHGPKERVATANIGEMRHGSAGETDAAMAKQSQMLYGFIDAIGIIDLENQRPRRIRADIDGNEGNIFSDEFVEKVRLRAEGHDR